MPQRTPPPGQLDMPLVWATEPADDAREPAPDRDTPPAPPERSAGALRLWAGMLADALLVLAAAAAAVALAAIVAAGISPAGSALAALAGLEIVTVVALGCLWGWRGTPGMLVVGVRFAQPVPFGRAWRTWLVWLPSLLLAGVPLALRVRGECAAERLAGAQLSSRTPPADA